MLTECRAGPTAPIARLRASVAPEVLARLTTVVSAFHEVELPDADFVHASLSLPFCAPGEFGEVLETVDEVCRREPVHHVELRVFGHEPLHSRSSEYSSEAMRSPSGGATPGPTNGTGWTSCPWTT